MGILNVTPDSFFDGGRYLDPAVALERARSLEADGADLVDIGGESSRPGVGGISPDEERRRLMPLLETITATMSLPVSVDTTRSRVAAEALAAGAHIINDVSTLRNDPALAEAVASAEAGLILMHSRGTPKDMQQRTDYVDPVIDVLREWRQGLRLALEVGVAPQSICFDPGIGFAKSLETNLLLMRALLAFAHLGFPVLVGHSRKSFIGQLLEGRAPDERLHGTIGASLAIALGGARILRVHDVKANRDALHVALAVLGAR
jgi:dihydropteroate synthase